MKELPMSTNSIQPSKELHLKVRAGFITQGSTLSAWCRKNNVNPTNARHALVGSWDGPKGRKLREELIRAAGLSAKTLAAA